MMAFIVRIRPFDEKAGRVRREHFAAVARKEPEHDRRILLKFVRVDDVVAADVISGHTVLRVTLIGGRRRTDLGENCGGTRLRAGAAERGRNPGPDDSARHREGRRLVRRGRGVYLRPCRSPLRRAPQPRHHRYRSGGQLRIPVDGRSWVDDGRFADARHPRAELRVRASTRRRGSLRVVLVRARLLRTAGG